MVELDHSFTPTDRSWDAILDLDARDDAVEVAERDDAARRAVLRVNSTDTNGTGYANADVTFTVSDGAGSIHTAARITGKAASMGEGVVATVLDALINDFTHKLAAL
jgi:carbon monoxide dehydrogenase subunit G